MTVASSSQTQLRYIPETTWGVTPATGQTRELRMTGETLQFQKTKDSSKEINKQRQIRSLATMDQQAQGAVNIEMSAYEYDWFLSALLRNDWVEYGTAGVSAAIPGTFATAAGKTTFTATAAPTGDDDFTTLAEGAYVGIAIAGGKITAHQIVAAPTSTELVFPESADLPAGAATIVISSASLKIGNIEKSCTLEKHFTDVNQFFHYKGMEVSKMDLTFQPGSFMGGSFDFMGRYGGRTAATVLPGTPAASFPHPSMSSVTGVMDVRMSGEPIKDKYNTWIREMTMSFDNQLEGLKALGELGSVAVLAKEVQLTGTMAIYLTDGSLYDDFINDVTNSLSWVVRDSQGRGYAFVLDKIDFSEMPVNAPSQGQPVMLSPNWTGLMGEVSLNSMTIYRL